MSDDRRPKILLSLDGGGTKGLSQIEILYDVIKHLKERNGLIGTGQMLREEDVFPCDYFDLIVGSGTGGINAILIGRLGLSIRQCREAWRGLNEVFRVELDQDLGEPLFSAEKLEAWAKDLIEEHTGYSETSMLIKTAQPNSNQRSCRVGVTSMRAGDVERPAVLRSYPVRPHLGTDCTIWAAMRATTAAPTIFKPVIIGPTWVGQEYINAELGINNPIWYLFQEKQKVWLRKDNYSPPQIGCVVSIGTGKYSGTPLADEPKAVTGWSMKRLFGNEPNLYLEENLPDIIRRISKDCEKKHQEVEASYGEQVEKVYFRLNVEQGAQDFLENEYDEETRQNIHAQVINYVRHSEQELHFERLIDKMAEVLEFDPSSEEPAPPYSTPANQSLIEMTEGGTQERSVELTGQSSAPTQIPSLSGQHLAASDDPGVSGLTFFTSLVTRADIGDPEPTKEVLRFLRIPYLLSERILLLARENWAFHILGVFISRQAQRLVLLLNAAVTGDGPNQEQLDERAKLRNQLVDLEAEMTMWRSIFGEKNEVGGTPGHLLLSFDEDGGQEQAQDRLTSGEAILRERNPGLAFRDRYSECIRRIKNQFDIFFAPRFYFPSPPQDREERFQRLLDFDNRAADSEPWKQSRDLGWAGNAEEMLRSGLQDPMEMADTQNVTPSRPMAIDIPSSGLESLLSSFTRPLLPGDGGQARPKPYMEGLDEAPATILRSSETSSLSPVDGRSVEMGSSIAGDYLDSRLNTAPGDAPMRPLRLLALDGGGIRGFSQLKILQVLMHRIQWDKGLPEPPKPCDYFDMMAGTSGGGIIAILLGRLRLSVAKCVEVYASLSMEMFGNERWGGGIFQSRFDHRVLERLTINLLEEMTRISATEAINSVGECVDIGDGADPEREIINGEEIKMYDNSPQACKTFVTATSEEDAQKGNPFLLRTYINSAGVKNEDCAIWQAIRATSAAPAFFDPIQIGDKKFVDGGFGCNNPVEFVYNEARETWPDREIGCIISLGTGMRRALPLENPTWFDMRFPLPWIRVLEHAATECETAHQEMLGKKELRGKYFRFNVQQGLQGVSLTEWQKLGEVAALTETYLESIKVEREVNQVVAKLIEFDDWLVGRKAKHMAKDNAQYHFEL